MPKLEREAVNARYAAQSSEPFGIIAGSHVPMWSMWEGGSGKEGAENTQENPLPVQMSAL